MLWEWKATKPTANQPGTSNPLWEKTMPSRKASTNLGLELHPIGLFNSWHDYKIFKILQLFQDSRTQSEPQKIPARRNFTRKINGTSEAWRQRFWAPHRWFRRNFHWSNGQMVKWSNGQITTGGSENHNPQMAREKACDLHQIWPVPTLQKNDLRLAVLSPEKRHPWDSSQWRNQVAGIHGLRQTWKIQPVLVYMDSISDLLGKSTENDGLS